MVLHKLHHTEVMFTCLTAKLLDGGGGGGGGRRRKNGTPDELHINSPSFNSHIISFPVLGYSLDISSNTISMPDPVP